MSIASDSLTYLAGRPGGFPRLVLPDGRKVEAPNLEFSRQYLRWRWLLDSYEGGEKYRNASYGIDGKGVLIRNLVRHKREYPDPVEPGSSYAPRVTGTDMAAQATDDDYELRRAHTPIPTFTAEAIHTHLGKIYDQEVRRKGPKQVEAWWKDVDGAGQSMDQWMRGMAAPLLMLYGQLDFLVERPPAPDGEEVETLADEIRLGLNTVVASYILPDNLPWWRLDRRGRYVECLVAEHDDDGGCRWRHWDATSWTLYDEEGKLIETTPHTYGRVPIVRVFDRRRPSCRHVGLPFYEAIAEIQREYYNRDSELILSDTTQAHPLLQGPEDYIKADGTVPVGPNWLLPKKKNNHGGTTSYEGFDVVPFPKDGAESIRKNKDDLRDAADRSACLTKPAGTSGGGNGTTVSQSGVSKQLDQSTGNKLLGEKAATLEKAEQAVAELAAEVLGLKIKPDEIQVVYPRQFELRDADELAAVIQGYQLVLGQAGATPEIDAALLSKLVRLMLPGVEDEEFAKYDAEIAAHLEEAKADRKARRESMPTDPAADPTDPNHDPAGPSAPDDPTEGE